MRLEISHILRFAALLYSFKLKYTRCAQIYTAIFTFLILTDRLRSYTYLFPGHEFVYLLLLPIKIIMVTGEL